jgi:dimethylargininase
MPFIVGGAYAKAAVARKDPRHFLFFPRNAEGKKAANAYFERLAERTTDRDKPISRQAAIAQLRAILGEYGYSVHGVAIRGCLHLKSAVTALADDTVLLQPAWVDRAAFAEYRVVEVDPAEEHAANVLRIGDRVVSPACFPRTHERIRAAGIEVVAVDVSELQKAEGAITCCSLVLSA